ncbi:MAG: 4Fe-4S binding protein [Candidatus Heimdallarchaeota archaeon]|nr:MAG: 4Fe-4S binding protein [Candidatus Heimdallarchaeota archaeon]
MKIEQVFAIIKINRQICVGCAYCSMTCPVGSFKVEGMAHFLKKCNKCGRCIIYCPVSAITKVWED